MFSFVPKLIRARFKTIKKSDGFSRRICCLSVLFSLALLPFNTFAKPLPSSLTAALLVKVANYEHSLTLKDDINILVINDKAVADTLLDKIGVQIAGGKLQGVKHVERYSGEEADIIFIGRMKGAEQLVEKLALKSILTVSGDDRLLEDGVVLCLYDNEGVPGILLNLESSKKSGLLWNPDILNFATPY